MSKHYGAIAFTEAVRDVQRDHGSHAFYDRKRIQGTAAPGTDALTVDEKDYLAQRDGFYLATVSETGWPMFNSEAAQPVSCASSTTTPSGGRIFAATCSTSAPATSPRTTESP